MANDKIKRRKKVPEVRRGNGYLPGRWTRLENTIQYLERQAEIAKQHGPVRILVKDGKEVGDDEA